MGSSRKAKARKKSVHTKVRVGIKKPVKPPAAVLLPGTEQTTSWAKRQTLETNYKSLGLALDPNGARGRSAPVQKPPADADGAPTLGSLAKTDEEELRVVTGGRLARGNRPPQQLTATQLRVMEALVAAHGDDVGAMARDIKRNALQHSEGKLRVMLDAYREQSSEVTRKFRAPIKRL